MHRKLKSNVRVIVFESIFLSKGYPGELHVLSPKGIELKREATDFIPMQAGFRYLFRFIVSYFIHIFFFYLHYLIQIAFLV